MKTKTKGSASRRNSTPKTVSYEGRAGFIQSLVKRGVKFSDTSLAKVRAKFPYSGKARVKAFFKRAEKQRSLAE